MPFDVRLYHPKWSLIRHLVLKRDWYTCQHCGAPDRAIGFFRGAYFISDSEIHDYYYQLIAKGYKHEQAIKAAALIGPKLQKIYLSVTHLDNDRENNRFSNLRSLCGRCHLFQDMDLHVHTYKYGVNYKDNQLNLFHPGEGP